jgi:hypothetical protein
MHGDRTGSPADAEALALAAEASAGQAETAQDPPSLCDACGESVPAPRDDDDGYDLPGRGVYLWVRGDKVVFEHVPLCARCASAIGMSALSRWEIEEEEG